LAALELVGEYVFAGDGLAPAQGDCSQLLEDKVEGIH
jgi:hypothetical protein